VTDEDGGTPEERAATLRQTADYWFALAPVPTAATFVENDEGAAHEGQHLFVVSLSLEPINVDVPRFGDMFHWVVTNVAALLYDMADCIDPEHPSRRPPPKEREIG
jgi:hypothetical protein